MSAQTLNSAPVIKYQGTTASSCNSGSGRSNGNISVSTNLGSLPEAIVVVGKGIKRAAKSSLGEPRQQVVAAACASSGSASNSSGYGSVPSTSQQQRQQQQGSQASTASGQTSQANLVSSVGGVGAATDAASEGANPQGVGTAAPNNCGDDSGLVVAECSRQQCKTQDVKMEQQREEEDEEEEDSEDDLNFDYEPVLTKILNEKKLALSNSPDVIKFLSSFQKVEPHQHHQHHYLQPQLQLHHHNQPQQQQHLHPHHQHHPHHHYQQQQQQHINSPIGFND